MGREISFTGGGYGAQVTGGLWNGTYSITAPFLELRGGPPFFYYHQGLDVGLPSGTNILCPFEGVVGYDTRVGDTNSLTPIYGNSVWINFDGGGSLFVAHLETVVVERGQRVSTNGMLGRSGNTGQSTGPHAHIQCSLGDTTTLQTQAIDPLAFLTLLAGRETAAPVETPPLSARDYATMIRDYAAQGVPSPVLVTQLDELITML